MVALTCSMANQTLSIGHHGMVGGTRGGCLLDVFGGAIAVFERSIPSGQYPLAFRTVGAQWTD